MVSVVSLVVAPILKPPNSSPAFNEVSMVWVVDVESDVEVPYEIPYDTSKSIDPDAVIELQ